jgi:hypothetical protein
MGPTKLTSGASALLQKAINNFKAINGRVPSAQEMAQIEQQASRFSMPTSGLRSGPSASPRASYELGTDLNLINPDTARDPFLTKMTTGRTTKGTNLRPIAQDVSDPSVVKNIEAQQMSGQLDELMPGASQGSTTPSSDYFANQSAAIEDAALQGNALDVLKNAFIQKNRRQPSETELKDIVSQFDEDELNAIVAQYNPARHQYGSQGVGIMSQRPPSAKGMTDFRNAARNEGVEESYLTKRQGNYPQYIQDELAIQRGELPAIALKEKKKRYKDVQPVDFYIDENGNPVKIYPTMKAEGGQITPRDMLAQMLVNQVTPQKFKNGGQPGIKELDEWTASQKDPYDMAPKMQAYEPGIRERATDAVAPYLEKIGMTPRRAREQASVLTGYQGGMDPYGVTAKTGIGPTMILDPLAPFEAAEQFKRGDMLGGLLSASILPGQAMVIKPLRTMGANKIKKSK